MKVCEYCGTNAEDYVLQCPNCGSKEFENICINCGKTFTGGKCPTCGVLVGEKPHICPSCGKKTFNKECPSCGADLISEKQNIFIYTYTNTEINSNTEINTDTETNIDLSAYEKVHKTKKKFGCLYKIFVFLVIMVFVIGIWNANKNDDESTLNDESTVNDGDEKIVENITDLEILTLDSHPKFYGDFKEAKRFWSDYKKVAVVSNGSYTKYEDKLLLVTPSDNNVITDITINFSHSEDIKHELTVEKVLKVVCEYIPYDIIEKYYTFTESFHETFKGDKKYEAYHYVMSLNKKGKSVNKSGDFYYEGKFAFKIIHRNDDDWIVEINYLAYEGNHDKFSADAYEVENWEVDLSNYK